MDLTLFFTALITFIIYIAPIIFILIIVYRKKLMLIIRNIFGTTIEINDYHIKNGKCFNQTKCPIALAVQEKLDEKYGKNEREAWVSSYEGFHIGIVVNNKAPYYEETKWSNHYFLPEKLKNFMNHFDSGIKIKSPFKFNLII